MKKDVRTLTLSIPPTMEADLAAIKQASYRRGTQNDMLKDLILRGLTTLKADDTAKKAPSEKTF